MEKMKKMENTVKIDRITHKAQDDPELEKLFEGMSPEAVKEVVNQNSPKEREDVDCGGISMEVPKNNVTELVFIIDASGSMAGLESDTIGGFNAMIKKQKKEEGKAYVSTVIFSNGLKIVHDRVDLERVKPMTSRDYFVGGGTALLDAIGRAIHHIGNVHRYARPEDVPAHTMFIITTDGMENASREYDSEKVKRMIRHKEKKYGWEFLFVAANIDAVETAERIGIRRERAANYAHDSEGTERLYRAVSSTVSSYRSSACVDDGWATLLGEKNKKEKK